MVPEATRKRKAPPEELQLSDLAQESEEPCAIPRAAEEETSHPPSKGARGAISKAAVRRLVHDAGARLSKEGYAGAIEIIEDYVRAILCSAVAAMDFSRRKSLSLEHVVYAAKMHGGLPEALLSVCAKDFSTLQKCNPRADASMRKSDLKHAELSEASFTKLMRGAADPIRPTLRVTQSARRMLQLLAEYKVMLSVDRKGAMSAPRKDADSSQRMMQTVFTCSQEQAQLLERALQHACEHMPSLLSMSTCKTVDERLVRVALLPFGAWTSDWQPPQDYVDARTSKLVDRVLRGHMVDKRVTNSASLFMACALKRMIAA